MKDYLLGTVKLSRLVYYVLCYLAGVGLWWVVSLFFGNSQ